jgi:hypothetical protein
MSDLLHELTNALQKNPLDETVHAMLADWIIENPNRTLEVVRAIGFMFDLATRPASGIYADYSGYEWDWSDMYETDWSNCPVCHGSGEMCHNCNGYGEVA